MLGVRLHIENPEAGPQVSHESWMAQKIAEGWVYGQTKDPEAKIYVEPVCSRCHHNREEARRGKAGA